MIKTRMLQINTFRSRPVHDLAISTANDLGIGILLMSEPNRNAIRHRKDWIFDTDIDSAIKIMDRNIIVNKHGKGQSYTYIVTPTYTIYNCYASGNKEIEELETMLDEIARRIRRHKENALILGDFNAKSPQWGENTTDERGERITEWVAQNDLVVLNRGNKPTFRRGDYTAILDLTIATSHISNKVTKWEVLDTESLSDHAYIYFEVTETRTAPPRAATREMGWQARKLDKTKLTQVLAEIETGHNENRAREFSQNLTEICNETMPKRKISRRGKPVFWWNDEIEELRRECLAKRRTFTRNRRRGTPEYEQQIENYKQARKRLRKKIKASKQTSWKALCNAVDCDIWGDGYKIVMRNMTGFPPRQQMAMQTVEEVVNHLFPVHEPVRFICDRTVIFSNFRLEELSKASDRLKVKKAPGPGNIPPEIIKEVVKNKPDYVLDVYNSLASRSMFPMEWKQATLMLLRKGDKPVESPSSYRPLCLLDVEGKLYEHLILGRLKSELERTGGLSERQYGFRENRQTADAIWEVMRIARDAGNYSWRYRRLCAIITLDIRNAFNSASWQNILDDLRNRGIDESLIGIVADYLSQRSIILEAEGRIKKRPVNSGVPQGSVLGPTLWNTMYDGLLKMEQPEGVNLIGFADDIALVVVAKGEEALMNKANESLRRITDWMEEKGLQLAPEKTEAALLTVKRKIGPIRFQIQNVTVQPSNAIKYLGVWLDTKMVFAEHVRKTIEKAEKTTVALASLMPNIGGPRASKRRLLSSVIHSQILYAAPVWHAVIENRKIVRKLASLQRKINIRITSAYRTISTEGVGIIAGVPPIDLMIHERWEKYNGIDATTAKQNLMRDWEERWREGRNGRWTYRLIPNIHAWVNRKYGEVDYYLTQALSGHGCFKKYLYEKQRSETAECPYCSDIDDVGHTLFYCPRWRDERQKYRRETGRVYNVDNLSEDLVSDEERWRWAYETTRKIIETKEVEERT